MNTALWNMGSRLGPLGRPGMRSGFIRLNWTASAARAVASALAGACLEIGGVGSDAAGQAVGFQSTRTK